MGIFDVFTGDSAKEAAAANSQLYANYGTSANATIDSYEPKETAAVTSGINSYNALSNLGQSYTNASNLLQDSLGVNGSAGTARAQAAYTTSPGYQFEVNQATDQATRSGNALGTGTGTIINDVTKQAQGYASKDYSNWQNLLSGYINPATSATTSAAQGQQSGYNSLAGIFGTNSDSKVNVAGNVASGTANSNTASANSQMQASSNFWNGLTSAIGSAVGGKSK